MNFTPADKIDAERSLFHLDDEKLSEDSLAKSNQRISVRDYVKKSEEVLKNMRWGRHLKSFTEDFCRKNNYSQDTWTEGELRDQQCEQEVLKCPSSSISSSRVDNIIRDGDTIYFESVKDGKFLEKTTVSQSKKYTSYLKKCNNSIIDRASRFQIHRIYASDSPKTCAGTKQSKKRNIIRTGDYFYLEVVYEKKTNQDTTIPLILAANQSQVAYLQEFSGLSTGKTTCTKFSYFKRYYSNCIWEFRLSGITSPENICGFSSMERAKVKIVGVKNKIYLIQLVKSNSLRTNNIDETMFLENSNKYTRGRIKVSSLSCNNFANTIRKNDIGFAWIIHKEKNSRKTVKNEIKLTDKNRFIKSTSSYPGTNSSNGSSHCKLIERFLKQNQKTSLFPVNNKIACSNQKKSPGIMMEELINESNNDSAVVDHKGGFNRKHILDIDSGDSEERQKSQEDELHEHMRILQCYNPKVFGRLSSEKVDFDFRKKSSMQKRSVSWNLPHERSRPYSAHIGRPPTRKKNEQHIENENSQFLVQKQPRPTTAHPRLS